MVATVLKLRYRILGNTLARRPWQLVGFIFGGLAALWMLVLTTFGSLALTVTDDTTLSHTLVVLAGAVVILGWFIGPIIVSGVDSTVDADHLAPFPLTRRQVMLALGATGLTGVPGIVTTLAALTSVIVWIRYPVAALVAIPATVLAVVTCVISSRLAATSSSSGRRSREIIGTIVLMAMMLTGPIIIGMGALADQAFDGATTFVDAANVVGWTPLGAAWSLPASVATGAWAAAALKALIAGATPLVLWWLWARALESKVTAPRSRAARSTKPRGLGLYGIFPSGGVGASWARALSTWIRDPRYLRQLVIVPLVPVLLYFAGSTGSGFLFLASPIVVAFALCMAGYSDVSYDGTAFTTVVASGVRGWQDRLGRVLGAACLGLPIIIAVSVSTAAIMGRWDLVPTVLGVSLGLLLAGYGVSAVSSALIAAPVAAPGDSPFKSVPGQTFLTGLAAMGVFAVCALLSLPSAVLAIIGLVRQEAMWGWLSLLVGIGFGLIVVAAGVALGGKVFDRRAPELLQTIKAFPTA